MRLAAVAATLLISSIAASAPAAAQAARSRGDDVVLVPPDPPRAARNATGPDTLYLDRCVGGCDIIAGGNDARTNHSSIPDENTTLSEFQYSDEIWNAVVACVADTYAPYGVTVVTEEPASGDYNEVKVAGSPGEMALDATTLGISPMANDCSPQVNWMAFAFANVHGNDPVLYLCSTVAHEAGHIYGLDHEYDCKDVMTYLEGCGHKWFLNDSIECGEFDGTRACRCGETQNSHAKLTSVLGEGELPPPPTVSIPYPTDGSMVSSGFTVFGDVEEDRVLARVEFWLNGWPWKTVEAERDVSAYSFTAPGNVPDGYIDVDVRAYNDLEVMGSQSITLLKGEPCTTADTCLEGQFCADGRCTYPEPTKVQGDTCAIDADCISRICASDGDTHLCAERCTLGAPNACDDGYTCLDNGNSGVCWPSDLVDGGGCCDAGGSPGSALALGAFVGLFVVRRRKRPAARA